MQDAPGEKARFARSFLHAGEDYERYRPGFPAEAVALVLPRRVAAVLDLGAGTGKLTRLLAAVAEEVFAVDPSERMLAQLRIACPTADARIGVAEDIPLGDATVDAVTVAQAFHWFRREPACAEIRRVLRAGGTLGLLWNAPDAECAWDIACGRIAHPHLEGDVPDQTTAPELGDLPGFEPVGSAWIRWREDIPREDYLRRWMTVSSFLVADRPRRDEMLARMDAVLDTDPETRGRNVLPLGQATQVLVYRRAEAPAGITP